MRDKPKVNESGDALEIFATHLLRIDPVGSAARLVFASRKPISGIPVDLVTLYVVVPAEQLADIARMILAGSQLPQAEVHQRQLPN